MYKKTGKASVIKLIKEEERITPAIVIDIMALARMKTYVDTCDDEIAWLGLVKKEDEAYVIYDVLICKQEISSVTAELHESGLQEIAEKLLAEGREDELNNVRAWGHSHVTMQVHASETDDETFEEYYKDCDYFIRMILNKKGDMCIDIAEPERGLVYFNVDWSIQYPPQLEELDQEYKRTKQKAEELEKLIKANADEIIKEAAVMAKKDIEKYAEKKTYQNNVWSKKNYEKQHAERYEIITFKNTPNKKWKKITDVVDANFLEIFSSLTTEDIEEKCKNIPELKGYTEEDWENLQLAAEIWLEDKIWWADNDEFNNPYYDNPYSGYGWDRG